VKVTPLPSSQHQGTGQRACSPRPAWPLPGALSALWGATLSAGASITHNPPGRFSSLSDFLALWRLLLPLQQELEKGSGSEHCCNSPFPKPCSQHKATQGLKGRSTPLPPHTIYSSNKKVLSRFFSPCLRNSCFFSGELYPHSVWANRNGSSCYHSKKLFSFFSVCFSTSWSRRHSKISIPWNYQGKK